MVDLWPHAPLSSTSRDIKAEPLHLANVCVSASLSAQRSLQFISNKHTCLFNPL